MKHCVGVFPWFSQQDIVNWVLTLYMSKSPAYRILPLGDSALLIDCGNTINDAISASVTGWFHRLKAEPLPGMLEVVPAYSSLAVYYDLFLLQKIVPPDTTVYEWMKKQVEERIAMSAAVEGLPQRLVRVPVCYDRELGADLEALALQCGLTIEEVIHIHAAPSYRVYMLGFLPGFPYMGLVDERIRMPRKQQPVPVAAGSVGIAGSQTGIYPFASPGGWCIIGRTPVSIFDADRGKPALLQPGDQVQFYSISRHEFENY